MTKLEFYNRIHRAIAIMHDIDYTSIEVANLITRNIENQQQVGTHGYVRSMEEFADEIGAIYESGDISEFLISRIFEWARTEEGYDFWSGISEFFIDEDSTYDNEENQDLQRYVPCDLKQWKFTNKKKG